MNLENGRIPNNQLIFLVLSFLQSMILTVSFAYPITRQDTWIAVLAAFVLSFFITLLYLAIVKRFPGKNLIQINDIVFGPYLGKLFSVIYIWYFMQLIAHQLYYFNSFWMAFIMPETPRSAFLIMFVFVSAMAVRKGIEVIARCSFLFTVIVTLSVFIVTVLLIGEMKPFNLMPIFEVSPMNFIHGVHIIMAIPILEIVGILMVLPYASDNRNVAKPVLLGLVISVFEMLVISLRDAAVLGPALSNMTSAPFTVTRLVDIANILTRLDILFAIPLLITAFMRLSVFYYGAVLGIAQIFKLRSYVPLVIPVGAFSIAISSNLFESDMQQSYAGMNIWPFNAMLYQLVIPVLMFIVILVRRLPKERMDEEEKYKYIRKKSIDLMDDPE